VNLDGVYKGIDFLLNVNLGYRFTIGKKVLVIGGGNVAMDVARSAAREVLRQHAGGVETFEPSQGNMDAVAAREMMDVSLSALRLGAQEVHLVCLENREEMPAALEEIEEAEEEGIIIHPGLGPKQIIGENGRTVALEVLKTKSVFDANRRFNPTFYDNSETRLACDTIIMAIGQAPNLQFLSPEDGVEISPRGLVAVNPQTLMTSTAGVFAGGDCVFGPRLIIDSVADGKRAAVGIDEFLRGNDHAAPIVEVEVLERHRMPLDLLDLLRPQIPMLPLNRRTGVTEVEIGFDAESAMAEAQRCLHCWVNTVFEGTPEDGTSCILCGGCVDVCPENCLELVSLDRISFDEATTGQLMEVRDLLGVELDDIRAEELGVIAGSAMLKDESRCIRCGLCAARCPAGTITMESFDLVSADPTGLISVESIDRPLRSRPPLAGAVKR
jgi:ferredoxin